MTTDANFWLYAAGGGVLLGVFFAFGGLSWVASLVGLGGVGSWAAEALARSGIGRLTLIDLDHVAESNINRQVLALESTTPSTHGKTKFGRQLLFTPASA